MTMGRPRILKTLSGNHLDRAARELSKREQLTRELKLAHSTPLIPGKNYLSKEERERIRSQFALKSSPSMPSVRRTMKTGLHRGEL